MNENKPITTDLGAVTAYAAAVEKGYTGTQDDFGQLLANFARSAQQVADDREAVKEMKNAVDQAANSFDIHVEEKKTEASESISAAANTAKEESVAAIQEASTSGVKSVQDKTSEGVKALEMSSQTGVSNITAAVEEGKKNFVTDNTLAIPGRAADAKVTGDKIGKLKEDLGDVVNQTMNVIKSKNLIGLPDGEYINAESQKRIKANVKNNVISVTSLFSSPPFGSRVFIPFSIEKDIKTALQVFCDYKVNNNFFVSIYNESKNEQLVAVTVTDNYVKSSTVNISKGNYFLSVYMGSDVLTEIYNSSIVVTLKCMMIDGTETSTQWEDPDYKKYEISTDEISKKIGVLKERPLFTTIESLWDTKLSMCVHGSDLYVGGYSGVSKYDLKNELAPELIKKINSENNFIESYGNSIPSMVVYNGFLYAGVRTSQAGFPSTEYVNGSIDIIKLDDFTLVSRNHINKKISRVSIYTKQDRVYLFVNLQMRGLHVYDVTNPESVLKIYDKDYPEGSSVHELQGGTFFSINEKDYYFATGFGDGFTIYDISDINNITEILYWKDLQKNFPNTHTFESVIDYPFVYMTIAPQHAYSDFDDRIQGILAVNISNLASLSYKLYEIPNEYKCKDVLSDPQPTQIRKRGNKLYINNSENGIAVFKIVENGVLLFDSIFKTENYNEKVFYNAIASIEIMTDGRIFVSDGKTLGKESGKVDLKQIRMYR